VTFPSAAGIELRRGKPVTITWKGFPGKRVRIQLLKGKRSVARVTSGRSTENDGSFDWTIPLSLKSGNDYRIKIGSVSQASSAHPFRIE